MNLRRFYPNIIMAATAVFALLWAIARAALQSITIDEADTYLVWVARPDPSHWEAASNNHVLNSLLMRLTTGLFGVSHLAVRAPALFGAAIYIAMAWALCRLLASMVTVQWPVFVGLVFNPFIFDHLVAARGYALALAFLLAAITCVAYAEARGWPRARAGAIASACLALSFAANFSFAIVDGFTMAAIMAWACARTQEPGSRVQRLVAFVLPGLLVTLFVSAPVVLKFPKGQLVYGAHSLGEWFGEIGRDSLYRLNPQIVNPMLFRILIWVAPVLIPTALVLATWQLMRGRGTRLTYAMLGILAASVAMHWVAFCCFHILLPKERTGIWVVPLIMLAMGSVAAGRRGLTIALYSLSIYFLLCLRLDHFREWYWDADMKKVYDVVAYYNHTYGVKHIGSNWMYSSALNFYRVASGRESLDEISGQIPTPPGQQLYVVNSVFEDELIQRLRLHVVYHGEHSEVVVALSPEMEAVQRTPSCGVN
jgi:hypothetical protein